jgi:O-succinylbenzoic acid--CoA ligase
MAQVLTQNTDSTWIIPDWLQRRADVNGQVVAIECGPVRLTFAQLQMEAGRFAGHLLGMGVRPGERVALLARDGVAYAVAMHAIMQCDAILVPLNTRLAVTELQYQLADAEANVLLHDTAHQGMAVAVAEGLDNVRLWDAQAGEMPQTDPFFRTHIDLRDVHALIYTSGTTGVPKGVMLTYGNHFWSATASAMQLGLNAEDRWLVPLPLFHVGGMSVLIRSLVYGTTAVIHSQFDPDAVNQAVEQAGINLVSVVPAMLQKMIELRNGRPYPPSLRGILLGGSAAPEPLLQACHALRVPVAQSYGLTECDSQVSTLRPEDGLRKQGSSGKPLLFTEIEIRSDGKRVSAGNVGEIVVRGQTVMSGYWKRPEETKQAIQGGWLYTGDIGYLDGESYLYVLDRRKDLIVSGGENVYPAEIESVLHAHPDVLEAAVIGVPDDTWGQVPVAFVVLRQGAEFDEVQLQAHCLTVLARYKVPTHFYQRDELPRNASGKLLRRHLREWYIQ